jgi:DNA polymerase-1
MGKKVTTKRRVVLLDTHAIIHRAYHALPDFTGPDGRPTGALYGLVAMVLKIVADLRPDYIAACYDLPKPTVRHEAYADYKGTRAKTDDALVLQLQESRKVFEAFSIPRYEREGFEADDLLGTIAHELRGEKDVEVIIASGDMDTLQLVEGDRVRVYTLKKGIQDTILYDEAAVIDRFGFPPKLIPDYKGLRGDPSDNIKGVPGIGEKTATELITSFGTIESLYEALQKGDEAFLKKGIKARMVGLLREHEEDARFSKALATIRLDAPIAFTLPEKTWHEQVEVQKMLGMCDEFGFRTLKGRIKTAFGRTQEDAAPEGQNEPLEEEARSERLKEAQVMLWLISSEFTNPSLDDILAFTKEREFESAYKELEGQLAKLGRVREVYERIEKPLIPVIEKIGKRGVLVDTRTLAALAKRYRAELEEIERRIYAHAGHEFNISSPKQLGEVLFDEMQITPERQKRTAGGQRSTRESELEKVRNAHPIIADILDYREVKKLLSTYIENLPAMLGADCRLHAEFLQTGTTTGRMASQNPNLQNIPHHSERGRAIRHAFVATEGFTLVALDYSQIELRLAAILSGDEALCAIFRSGRDVHQEVAARVFCVQPEEVTGEMRRRAKIINFGILYGMGINALRSQLGTTTAETHVFYESYFGQFKALAEYLEATKGFARTHGYTETLFGRRRQFPDMRSSLPYVRAQAERMAINAPIQGTQADIIKLAMVRIDSILESEQASEFAFLLLQVHDELVYEIRSDKVEGLCQKIREIMERVLDGVETRGVPILTTVKTGPDWGSMRSV